MRQTEKVALVNGRIHTPAGIVGSLTFGGGRIMETGALPDTSTGADGQFRNDMRVIDLHGRTVLPGFCDADARLLQWAVAQEHALPEGGRPFDDVHPGDEDLAWALRAHAPKLAALGLTEVWSDDLSLFSDDFHRAQGFFTNAAGELPFRLREQLRLPGDALSDYLADGWRTGDGTPFCQTGAVVCGTGSGQEDMALDAHLSGMQLLLDAGGDALEGALGLLERAQERRNTNARHLLRVQSVDGPQSDRVRKLRAGGIIRPIEGNGESRLDMMRKGIVLASGSGGTEFVSPLAGIQALVSQDAAERLSVAEAIGTFTWNAAWNGRNERRRGELAPGRDADLVVLDRDPFSAAPEELSGIEVVLTVCGGCVTYDAGKL